MLLGPCRGRTYGALIKSEQRWMAEVFDTLGYPFINLLITNAVVYLNLLLSVTCTPGFSLSLTRNNTSKG